MLLDDPTFEYVANIDFVAPPSSKLDTQYPRDGRGMYKKMVLLEIFIDIVVAWLDVLEICLFCANDAMVPPLSLPGHAGPSAAWSLFLLFWAFRVQWLIL